MGTSRTAILALVAVPVWATTITVCNTGGCTYTNAQIQTALNAVVPGDTLVLQAGFHYNGNHTFPTICTPGQYVTIQSSAISQLPVAGQRLTYGYVLAGLIPFFSAITQTDLPFAIAGAGTCGVHFIGIGFDTQFSAALDGSTTPVVALQAGPNSPTGDADLLDDFVLDRCFVGGDGDPHHQWRHGISLATKRSTIINSLFRTYTVGQPESQCFYGTAAKGPITAINNWCGDGNGEGVIFGGGGNSYTGGGLTAGFYAAFNYFYNSLRFYNSAGAVTNPYASGTQMCQKNFIETKHGDGYQLFYNSGENSWSNCGSQFYAWSATPKPSTTLNLIGAHGAASLQPDQVTVTFTAAVGVTFLVNQYIGLPNKASPSNGLDYEWQRIVTLNSPTSVTVGSAYTNAYTLANCGIGCTWGWTPDGDAYVANYTSWGNVAREVNVGSIIAGTSDENLGYNHNLKMLNLLYINDFNSLAGKLLKAVNANAVNYGLWEKGVQQQKITHNTWSMDPGMNANIITFLGRTSSVSTTGQMDGWEYRSNLHPKTTSGLGGAGVGEGCGTLNPNTITTNFPVYVTHNTFMYNTIAATVYQPCTAPRISRQNLFGNNASRIINPMTFRGNNAFSDNSSSPQDRDFGDDDWALVPNPAVTITAGTAGLPTVLTAAHNFKVSAAPFPTVSVDITGGTGCWAALNGRWVGTITGTNTTFSVPADTSGCGSFSGQSPTAGFSLIQSGHDAQDVGVDPEELPLIQYLTVTPAAKGILFQFRTTSPQKQLVAQLEVSPNSALYTDAGTYSLVADLDPLLHTNWIQSSVNPNVTRTSDGTLVWWWVGNLSPSTPYYYRLMLGGARQAGSVTTLSAWPYASNPSVTVSYSASVGTKAQVRYGQQVGSLTTAAPVACSSGCSLTIPTVSANQIIYFVDETDNSNTVVYTASVPVVMPVP